MVRQSPRKAKAQAAPVTTAIVKETVSIKTKVKVEANGIPVEKSQVVETKVEVKKKAPAPKRKSLAGSEPGGKPQLNGDVGDAEKPAPKKRKTKAEKEEEKMPIAARTAVASLKKAMYIGAHVSAAGGVQNSIQNAVHIGANAFALFLKSQRKWESPPLASESRDQFHSFLKEHDYNSAQHILPHGSYLVNLAQLDQAKADQAYDNFVDDLKRCEALGIKLYNFHPGSTGGEPRPAALSRIAKQLNKSHKATKSVITVIENMCGSGNVIGSTFEELRDIIAEVEDKSRVGVCIDTCHAFAAGHDLRSPEAFAETMAKFDKIVGLKYLKALHVNDSKAPYGSHRDLHANIGTGFLGLRAFHNLMNFPSVQNLPLVLETPIDVKGPDGKTIEDKKIWAEEIKLLESLIGMDANSAEFQAKEIELQAKGAEERKKIQDQVDKKSLKDAKKAAPKAKRKGKKSSADDSDEDDSD